MPDPLPTGRDGPHVFVDDLDAPVLDDADRHHFERVLRLRPGDDLTVSDGAGRWRPATLGGVGAVEVTGEIRVVDAPTPAITVAFAPVKGERPEWAVQKLTELGVDRIVVFTAERSVVRWDGERAAHHLGRLTKIAREAAMQSRRCHLPEVTGVSTFADVAALPGAALAERDGEPPSLERPTILVGPEGGWSPAEAGAGLPRVALAATVLRAETAAVAAGALLGALRGGWAPPGMGSVGRTP